MKLPATCPHCQQEYQFSFEHEGKDAKCKACGEPFRIQFSEQSPPSFVATPPTIVTESKPEPPQQKKSSGFTIPNWILTVAGCLLIFFFGYIVGREHIKYEIRSSLASIGEAFTGNTTEPPSSSQPRISLGQSHTSPNYRLQISSIEVGKPRWRDHFGDQYTAEEPYLVVTFEVLNTSERLIIRPRQGSIKDLVQVHDDVGNLIRPIRLSFGDKLIGITGTDDVNPGATGTCRAIFDVPPPKTEHLTLAVDLELLGSEEPQVVFEVQRSQIKGF